MVTEYLFWKHPMKENGQPIPALFCPTPFRRNDKGHLYQRPRASPTTPEPPFTQYPLKPRQWHWYWGPGTPPQQPFPHGGWPLVQLQRIISWTRVQQITRKPGACCVHSSPCRDCSKAKQMETARVRFCCFVSDFALVMLMQPLVEIRAQITWA